MIIKRLRILTVGGGGMTGYNTSYNIKVFNDYGHEVKQTLIKIAVNRDPPGAGKTHTTKQLICNNPNLNFVIFSETHKTLEEYDDLPDTIHWKGFDELCSIPEFVELSEYLSASVLCAVGQKCGYPQCDNCPYRQQFQTKARVIIAPFEFAQTKYFDKRDIDYIIIEERANKYKILSKPPDETLRAHLELFKSLDPRAEKHAQIYSTPEEFYIEFGETLQKIVEHHVRNLLIGKGLTDEVIEEIKTLCAMQPKEIKLYYLLAIRYCVDRIAVPYLYHIMDLALEKGANIIINDASVKKEFLELLVMRCWENLMSFNKIMFNYKIEYNDNPTTYNESEIIRINPFAWYPQESLNNPQTLNNIVEDIRRIATTFRLTELNIVTYKSLEKRLQKLLRGYKINFLHFGNLRSRNDFKDKTIGFVIGTYNVPKEAVIEECDLLFPHHGCEPKLTRDENKQIKFEDTRDVLLDVNIYEIVRQMKEDDEMYQAIHRFRPLRKPTKIFVWGLVPEQITKEVQYYELNRKDLMRWLHKQATKLGKAWSAIDSVIDDVIGEFRESGYELIPLEHLIEEVYKRTHAGKLSVRKAVQNYIERYRLGVLTRKSKGRGRPKIYVML